MGVHGLWKLIEPTGQMVPLETLAGKVLAVDVSIWLHQAVKGMHDAQGAPVAVAHILILFHRICKLLFYKIKPVFVFDGGVPALKRQTMAARRQRSTAAKSEAIKVREKLIKNLLKHEAVRHMLSDEAASAALGLNSFTLPGPSVEEDLYKLPPVAADFVDSECSEDLSSSGEENEKHVEDIHSIDVTSQEFLSLPPEVRHDILTELIETRKQSSWKYLESMPKKSDSFSDFQMNRLLKRHAVQTSLEKAGKEMGGKALSLKELESLLGDQGVLDPKVDLPSKRIAQDSVTRFMLVQKDAEENAQTEEKKKFDIMNNLEDVEWSSESDTDVILQRSPERQKKPIEAAVDKPVENKTSATQKENNESHNISRRLKVRMTEEVADILSILEDEDATSDVRVKVENLQTKIDLSSTVAKIKTEPETSSCENIKAEKIDLVNEPENVSICELSQKCESQSSIAESTSGLEMKENGDLKTVSVENQTYKEEVENKILEKTLTDKKRIQAEVPETNLTDRIQVEMSEISPKSTTLIDGGEKTIDSSSDSENDFIPISTEESENLFGVGKKKKPNESQSAVPTNKALTVVINPSETNEKDDLFADIFQPTSHKLIEPNPVEKEQLDEVIEGETIRGSENVNDTNTEFREQILKGDINELRKNLEEEHLDLMKEKGKQERLAVNMNDQIYTDAQELLRLFGIPFVVAPMEAEAQCATLNILGLTEGTITDDSDIWLFGGQVVYKNFFNQQKHVLEYKSENIQKHFKLNREEMIKMALLVGSDYTVGLSGIGPVTALEIIAAFQSPKHELLDGLQKFREWFLGTATGGPLRATLRKKIKNTVITPGFPSRAVVEAYLQPQIDDSKEPFSWAKPNPTLIQKYVRAKLGWSNEKCNELLQPVLKKLEENTSQSTIDRHFKIIQKPTVTDGLLSKRVENAIKRLGGASSDEDEPEIETKPRKKRKPIVKNTSNNDENTVETSKTIKKPRGSSSNEPSESSKNFPKDKESKIKLINQRLHENVKVPQKEMAQKFLEEKKKEAIKIFRTFKKGGKKKTKVYAKEEIKLSESSEED